MVLFIHTEWQGDKRWRMTSYDSHSYKLADLLRYVLKLFWFMQVRRLWVITLSVTAGEGELISRYGRRVSPSASRGEGELTSAGRLDGRWFSLWNTVEFSSFRKTTWSQHVTNSKRCWRWECNIIPTSFPGSSLSREKDPGWVWSRGTQILGGDK